MKDNFKSLKEARKFLSPAAYRAYTRSEYERLKEVNKPEVDFAYQLFSETFTQKLAILGDEELATKETEKEMISVLRIPPRYSSYTQCKECGFVPYLPGYKEKVLDNCPWCLAIKQAKSF